MTIALDIERIVCHQCYVMLEVGDNFCRHCGAETRSLGAPRLPAGDPAASSGAIGPAAPEEPSARPVWSESPYVVVLLLLALGPLGLPILWRSRQFSPVWKMALTILVAALTLLLFAKIWYGVQESLAPLRQLQSLQGL